mgnify:CR=1 FL=1
MTKIILGHTGFLGQTISKIFNNFGIDQNYVMHLAIGTTFSIILPTE